MPSARRKWRDPVDIIDLRLLDLMQRDATLTNEGLAERVGASASAVHRRLRKLRAEGVIKSINAVIDPATVGRALSFIVGLEIERKQPDLYDRLQRWLRCEDAVQQAYNVTGSSDFVIVATASTVEQFDALMDRMLVANPNVKKYNTNVVLRSFKQCLFVPVLPD